MEHLKQDFIYVHIFRDILAGVRYSNFILILHICSTALNIRALVKLYILKYD